MISSTPPSDEDVAVLARLAGFELPPPYLAELADAYRHVAPILQRVRRNRAFADEPSQVFVAARFDPGSL